LTWYSYNQRKSLKSYSFPILFKASFKAKNRFLSDAFELNTFDDVVKVKDLIVPAGITITNPNAEDLVVKVTEALTEDEIKAMETAAAPVDLSKIETAGKKKEEGEEGAEGAAKPEAGEKKEEKKEEKK